MFGDTYGAPKEVNITYFFCGGKSDTTACFQCQSPSALKAMEMMKCIATGKSNQASFNGFATFHAGRFLREELLRSGHNVEWLAECMGMEKASVEALFGQDNMDAKLFVQLGNHIGNRFFERLHVIIFGHEKETKQEVVSQH